jgi:hypothetical protein
MVLGDRPLKRQARDMPPRRMATPALSLPLSLSELLLKLDEVLHQNQESSRPRCLCAIRALLTHKSEARPRPHRPLRQGKRQWHLCPGTCSVRYHPIPLYPIFSDSSFSIPDALTTETPMPIARQIEEVVAVDIVQACPPTDSQ